MKAARESLRNPLPPKTKSLEAKAAGKPGTLESTSVPAELFVATYPAPPNPQTFPAANCLNG